MPKPRPLDIVASRRLAVETPETVVLEFELAGLGARAAAAVIDAVLIVLLMIVLGIAWELMPFTLPVVGGWAAALFILLAFAVIWGYFVLFEALGGGRTPGKRWTGIRVVMDTGHPITVPAAVARNLLRIVDLQPFATYGVGIAFVLLQAHHKRLGDLVAGTIVVRDRAEDAVLAPAPAFQEPAVDGADPPRLSDAEYRLLDRLLSRLDDLTADARARFVGELAGRFHDRGSRASDDATQFLVELHARETERRRARTAIRRDSSGTRAAGTADRFVALRRETWEAFRDRAAQLERRGLKGLGGDGLLAFAAGYRAVAADLARARTYRVEPRTLAYLERVVSMGHNALYGLRGTRRPPLTQLLLHELPTAVYRARYYVLTALALFVGPGVIGYALIREDPDVAYAVIPDGMIARAEAGAYEQAAGRGYAEMPSPYLPMVASQIIANNVQVAFSAFAFGITAGLGTVFVLLFNGLFFGAVLGLFANYGLAGWILTFVAGHGVLELTAIFIAGGAGLQIGRAVVAPGDLARRDALVVHGRSAVRLVGAAVLLLLLAGLIEGLLSASSASASLKLGVSGLSAVLLVLLFAMGRRSDAQTPRRSVRQTPRRSDAQTLRRSVPRTTERLSV